MLAPNAIDALPFRHPREIPNRSSHNKIVALKVHKPAARTHCAARRNTRRKQGNADWHCSLFVVPFPYCLWKPGRCSRVGTKPKPTELLSLWGQTRSSAQVRFISAFAPIATERRTRRHLSELKRHRQVTLFEGLAAMAGIVPDAAAARMVAGPAVALADLVLTDQRGQAIILLVLGSAMEHAPLLLDAQLVGGPWQSWTICNCDSRCSITMLRSSGQLSFRNITTLGRDFTFPTSGRHA